MGSTNVSKGLLLPWFAMIAVLVGLSKGDLEKDRRQCADALVGLATCLPYVGGEAVAPTMDCCAKLKPVLHKNKVCLCILVKDRNDPGLGLKINATLALGLPDSCHSPTNITECPKLMNLPPNSTEAKIFEDYGKNVSKSDPTTMTTPDRIGPGGPTGNRRGPNWFASTRFWRGSTGWTVNRTGYRTGFCVF